MPEEQEEEEPQEVEEVASPGIKIPSLLKRHSKSKHFKKIFETKKIAK